MRSLFQSEEPHRASVLQTGVLSIALHAILLALIIAGSIHVRRAVIFRPLNAGSSEQIAVVAVSRGALAAVLAAQTPAVPEKSPTLRANTLRRTIAPPAKRTPALKAMQPAQPSHGESSAEKNNPGVTGQGNDAQNMFPAYPTVSPSPQVRDRSLLPQADQKVVVEVDLGADGQIQQARLVSGLGNALDQLVLDTVRGWQFHPATQNGQPVTSRVELVFPFNKHYPQADD